MKIEELRELIKELSFDDNAKVVVLVCQQIDDPTEWHIMKCDDEGKVVSI